MPYKDKAAVRWSALMAQVDTPPSRGLSFRHQVGLMLVFSNKFGIIRDLRLGDLYSPNFQSLDVHMNSKTPVWVHLVSISPSLDGFGSVQQRYRVHWPYRRVVREFSSEQFFARFQFPDDRMLIELPIKQDVPPSLVVPKGSAKGTWVKMTRTSSGNHQHINDFVIHVVRTRSRREWVALEARRSKNRKAVPSSRPTTTPVVIPYYTNSMRTEDAALIFDNWATHNVTARSRTESRVNTPGFFLLKKSQRPVNAYSMSEVTYSNRVGYQRVQTTDQSVQTVLTWVGPSDWFEPLPAPVLTYSPEARSKAFKRLLNSMGSDPFNVAADLVQFRQVTNMISSNAKRILGSYRAVKRLDFPGATRILFGNKKPRFRKGEGPSASKSLANNWLEFQYGWKPLLNDIDSLIRHVHRGYYGDVRVARSSGSAESTVRSDVLGPKHISLATIAPYPIGERVTVKLSTVRFGIRYVFSDKDKAFLAQTGFTSPVNLAWELLPFSFVVDWFLPIGPYLESLSAFEGLRFVDGFESRFTRETTGIRAFTSSVRGTAPQRCQIDTKFGAQRNAVAFERVKLTTFPSVPSVRFKNPISVSHAQNAVALLVTTMKAR